MKCSLPLLCSYRSDCLFFSSQKVLFALCALNALTTAVCLMAAALRYLQIFTTRTPCMVWSHSSQVFFIVRFSLCLRYELQLMDTSSCTLSGAFRITFLTWKELLGRCCPSHMISVNRCQLFAECVLFLNSCLSQTNWWRQSVCKTRLVVLPTCLK